MGDVRTLRGNWGGVLRCVLVAWGGPDTRSGVLRLIDA